MPKKGVSVLMSAVLLIAITVLISLITADFLSKTAKGRTQEIADTAKEKLECQFANLYIRNLSLDCNNNCASGTNHMVTATVVNSGKKSIKVEGIYIRNTTGSLFVFGTGQKELNASDVLTISNSSTVTCGGINRTIDNVIISSNNCPSSAFDTYPGSEVVFLNC